MEELLSRIASRAPAPASGSAAAAVTAIAAALVQKVALLSSKQWPDADETYRQAEALRMYSDDLIEKDSLAYLAFVEAVRSGGDVAGAEAATVDIPLDIVRAAAGVSALAERSASLGNPKLLADAVVAGMLASAAAQSAAFLVAVNVNEATDARVKEAQRLAKEASARLRSPGARGSSGGPGRGRARSAGSHRR